MKLQSGGWQSGGMQQEECEPPDIGLNWPSPPRPAGGGGVGGMLKAVIDTVIGNLQLSISNVHIRSGLFRFLVVRV